VQAVLDLGDVVLPDSGQLLHSDLGQLGFQPTPAKVCTEQRAIVPNVSSVRLDDIPSAWLTLRIHTPFNVR
jgi:hypothetical protein